MNAAPQSGPGRGKKPSLDNKETVGKSRPVRKVLTSHLPEKCRRNRRRLAKVTKAKRINNDMGKELAQWLPWFTHKLSPESLAHMIKLQSRLGACAQHSLMREFADGECEFIGSHTCKHKVCNVCNMLRCTTVRRKFHSYLRARPELLESHDFQHLMLTVPHNSEGGFRGEKFYLRPMLKLFNEMRKHKYWKEMVWAGEYGVEVTRNEHGLHIHIHALLLLPKVAGSRNSLYSWLLQYWNRVTVDPQANRHSFNPEEVESIAKGLMPKHPTAEQIATAYAITARLNPRGSTILHLESLYVKRPNGSKRYVNSSNLDDLMSGVMECIKYHFAPFAMMKKGEGYDFWLLAEILPLMYKQPLYSRFGAWRKEQELNLNASSPEQEMAEILAETGHDEMAHPVTGELVHEHDIQYFITSAAALFVDPDSMRVYMSRKGNKAYLPRGISTRTACQIMLASSVPKRKKKEPDPEDFYPT